MAQRHPTVSADSHRVGKGPVLTTLDRAVCRRLYPQGEVTDRAQRHRGGAVSEREGGDLFLSTPQNTAVYCSFRIRRMLKRFRSDLRPLRFY